MQMDTVSMRLEKVYPDLDGWRAQVMSFRTNSSADTRTALLVLMAATTFVLLIACANIANLLLARSAGRANEFAVRNALGASQGRLVWQLLTESAVVCLAGEIIGVLLASGLCKGLAGLAPDTLLRAAPDLARLMGVLEAQIREAARQGACLLARICDFSEWAQTERQCLT